MSKSLKVTISYKDVSQDSLSDLKLTCMTDPGVVEIRYTHRLWLGEIDKGLCNAITSLLWVGSRVVGGGHQATGCTELPPAGRFIRHPGQGGSWHWGTGAAGHLKPEWEME